MQSTIHRFVFAPCAALVLAACGGGAGSSSTALHGGYGSAIAHVGHDQCYGAGSGSSAMLPLYQAPTPGDVLVLIDFFDGATTRTLSGGPWIAGAQGNNFAIYVHVVSAADTTTQSGPYANFGNISYSSAGMHGACISEWRGVDTANPIAASSTNAVSATTLVQSIAVNGAPSGAIAYAMFASAQNARPEPALESGWREGDYSNVCSVSACGPLPHVTDISEFSFVSGGSVTASITWPASGSDPAYSALVVLNPAK